MKVTAPITLAVFSAVLLSAPLSAQNSLVRIPSASPSQLEAYLPPLPADMPWLYTARQKPAADAASPEADSLRALLWQPTPARFWPTPPTTQSATVATMAGG